MFQIVKLCIIIVPYCVKTDLIVSVCVKAGLICYFVKVCVIVSVCKGLFHRFSE